MKNTTKLPDGSAFFVSWVRPHDPGIPPVRWNPWNKVVQDHRDGTIDQEATNVERAKRNLPVPWEPGMAEFEVGERAIP